MVTGVIGQGFGGRVGTNGDYREKTFRWTKTEGMVPLDLLSGTVSNIPVGISGDGSFIGDKPVSLNGAFDNFAADNVFKATFGGSFGSISFGNILPTGLEESVVAGDLSVVGSLDGGGALGEVDLIYVPVPEPASAILLFIGVLMSAIAGAGRYRHAVFPFPR